jgi:hypothetical protein
VADRVEMRVSDDASGVDVSETVVLYWTDVGSKEATETRQSFHRGRRKG